MFCFRALLLLSACVVYGQKKEKTNVFTMRPISTIYLPHYVAGKKSWGINKDAAVKTAYDMDTKLAYSAGKKWIHVVDFADVFFPKILDKFESPTPLTDIAECGEYVAWAVEGAEITDSGSVVLYEKFSRVGRKWTRKCEFVVGSRPKSIKFTKDCSTIVVANEGVADVAGTGAASQWVNPEGTVSIIRLYGRNHQSQGSRGGGGGGTNSWGNQGGTNWGNAGGRGQWGNTGQGGQGNWNNRGQNTGGGGWNNRGQNQGPNVGGPNGGGRGWNNQGPNQGGRFPNQGPNNRGNGWNNQGPNQGGWGPNQGPNQGWGPNQGPNQGPNTGGRGWNNQGPNQGPNTGGRGWNNQGPNQGPNTGGQGWNNQGPNQGGRGPNQGPNAGGTGWNNRGNNQGPNAGGQGWNNQGPNRGGTGWNNQGPNQGGRGPNQGPNTGGQGWNNQGPNRGPNQGPNTGGRGWNNQGPNQGPNTGGRGWNNQGPNQGGRGPNQGPNGGGTGWNNQGPNQGGRVPNQGPNRGGTGWNNQGPHGGGARGNPQIPNQGGPNQGPNAGGTGWNRGQTNGPNAGGRFPNNGNPTWQQGRGQAGNNPPNNRPNNPGQGPWLIQHELGHLIRQKRQYPPPPQTPQWQPQTPQWQPQTPQWQPQTPRWQPPQRPTFPQTPARGPGGAPPQGPGFNPGRGQGQGPWQNPGQRPGQGPGQRPGQRPGQFPQTPARQNPGGPQGQSPRQGVTTSRGTCSGGGNFNPTVTTLDFTKFNPRADWFKAQLVRHPYTGQMGDKQENTFSQGLEPEYVTFDPMETTAYVSLQENNAIASVDLFSNEITGIHPLGAKQWKRYDLDPSPGNGRGFQKYDIESFRQPDAIESYTTANGDTYILTANEGKQLEYTCNLNACPPGGGEFVEFEKGDEFPEDYWLTAKLLERVSNEEMLDAFRLGNLEFSRIDGRSVEQPLKHDNVYFYGGRGISAYRVDRRTGNLTLAWDSGDIIEKATAKYLPKIHNGNNRVGDPSITMASTFDSWSDQRGPECESLAVGDVQGTKLIFVGIDRISAIAIFSVSPSGKLPIFESIFRDGHIDKSFTELYRTKRFGDSDPESLTFIPPEKSVDRRPYLMVTGRVSGTISLYQIRDEPIWMLLKNSPSRDFRLLGSLPVVLLSTVLAIVAGYRRLV